MFGRTHLSVNIGDEISPRCLSRRAQRRAANLLTFELAPEKTARLCLGGAFTKDAGQRALARNASRVVAIEGCSIECATRMMKGVVPGLNPEVVIADSSL